MIGQTLGRYRVLARIGAGGMGEVYRARDEQLERDVAVKVLPASQFADPEARRRLLREAKAAAALNHPNLCTIHEVGEADGQVFLAMELIEGQRLDRLIPEGGLSTEDALRHGIADAVAHAHARGIVHRDLKASNTLVTPEGRVKVLDFGLAKRVRDSALSGADTESAPLTDAGAVVGTVPYMAPEVLSGQPADARSDVWSLGVVLFEMAAGSRPFQGRTGFELSSAILSLPPAALPATVPVELSIVVERCLEKSPERRYQRAGELHAALQAVHTGTASRSSTWRSSRRFRRHWIGAAALLALFGAGFLLWRWWPALRPGEPLRAVALTTLPGLERYPSLSPDGNYVTFMWTGPKQDNADIYVQMIGAGAPLRLTTDPRGDTSPRWSPDGRWIAFLRGPTPTFFLQGNVEVRLIAPLGGPERKVAELGNVPPHPSQPAHLAWCPDSTCLVVSDFQGERKPNALFVLSMDTGEKRQLTHPQRPTLLDTNPVVSPDGRSLVFQRFPTGAGVELHLLPLAKGPAAAGEARRLTASSLNAIHPSWMPDGKEVLFSAWGGLWRLASSGQGPPARLPFVGEDGLWPVVSGPQPGRPSRLVYVRSFEDSNIWRVETSAPGVSSTAPPRVVISSTRDDTTAEFSPDGRRVAFSSDRAGQLEIWVADPDGSSAVQLTSMGGRNTASPRWSRDAQLIAFDSDPEGQKEIYVVPSAGGKPRRLTSHPALDVIPSFSPDGDWIYFTSLRTGEAQIWKVPVAGGEPVQVTDNVGFVARPSRDGASLYYTQTSGPQASALWRLPTSGGKPEKVLEGVVMRAFAPIERGIYYVDQPAGDSRLQFFDFSTQRSTTVARDLGNVRTGLTASPDGRTILYTRLDSSVDNLMLVENFR